MSATAPKKEEKPEEPIVCDDEFEEFPTESWDAKDEAATEAVWATTWDDDDESTDFVAQLRAELSAPSA